MRALPPLLLLLPLVSACQGYDRAKDDVRRAEFEVGSALPEPKAFRDASVDFLTFRRVLVVPLLDESGNGAQSELIDATLRDELAKLRRFDVVQPSESDGVWMAGEGPKKSGRIDVGALIQLGQRYNVDAVLFGAIDNYRPYAPPSLGLSMSLVDVQTGKIVWEVRDVVDSADKATAIAMSRFYTFEVAYDQTIMDASIMSASPQWFARFAARRVAKALQPPRDETP